MYFNFLSDQRIARCSPAGKHVGLVIAPGYPLEGFPLWM
jgi:hypothetical protein